MKMIFGSKTGGGAGCARLAVFLLAHYFGYFVLSCTKVILSTLIIPSNSDQFYLIGAGVIIGIVFFFNLFLNMIVLSPLGAYINYTDFLMLVFIVSAIHWAKYELRKKWRSLNEWYNNVITMVEVISVILIGLIIQKFALIIQ